jgi:YjbR protein
VHPTFEAILARFAGEPDVEQGTGWRSPGLRVRKKIFAMLVDGEFVVKLPADRCADLVAAGHGHPFTSGGRRMREWVAVSDEHAADWMRLAEDAYAFVGGNTLAP